MSAPKNIYSMVGNSCGNIYIFVEKTYKINIFGVAQLAKQIYGHDDKRRILFSSILPIFEYYGNRMEETQKGMARSTKLRGKDRIFYTIQLTDDWQHWVNKQRLRVIAKHRINTE